MEVIPRLPALLLLVAGAGRGAGQDRRCLLEGGWSTVSFFVREDLPVNSLIGRIRAIGTVSV